MREQDPARAASYRASGDWPDETFSMLLARQVARHPNKPALCDDISQLTYRELAEGIERVAAALRENGIGSGDLVAVQIPNWNEFVLVFYALERVGAVSVAVSTDFRRAEVEYILQFTGCRGYVGCGSYRRFDYAAMIDALRPSLPTLQFVGVVRGSDRPGAVSLDRAIGAHGTPRDFVPVAQNPDAMMRILFTSGTTGKPKGVTHNHNTSLWPCRMLNRDLELGPDEVMLLYLPLGLNWGYLTVVQAVMSGSRVVLMDRFDALRALELIQREGVTYIPTAPASIIAMLSVPDFDRYDLSSLRIVVSGGTPCPVETIRAFRRRTGAVLIELYGMLETGGYHTYTRLTDIPDSVAGTVGRPGTHMKLRIRCADGLLAGSDTSGEIECDGPGTQLGYYRNPEANAQAFTPDGWFRTGDLGLVDERGNLRIVGRLKEIINRGGKKFYPREIEEILYSHPKVLHAAMIGIPDARLGESNCLCLVPRPGVEKPALQEFIEYLRDRVADYKLPERLELFDELSYTPTGKVQRHALLSRVLERKGS